MVTEEIPAITSEKSSEERPEKFNSMEDRVRIARQREDKHIENNIIACGNKTCPRPYWKFVKGMGVTYVIPSGDKYYFCSDECKMEYLKAHGVKGAEYTAGVYGE